MKSTYVALVAPCVNNSTISHDFKQKNLWKLKLQDTILIWKVAHNILPTRSLLKRCKKLEEEQTYYPLCHSEEETLSDLLFSYQFSRILWRHSSWPIDISNALSIPVEESHNFQLFALLAIDNIWYLRKQVSHDYPIPSPTWSMSHVLKLYSEHKQAWTAKNLEKETRIHQIPTGFHLIQFDVAIRSNGSTTT